MLAVWIDSQEAKIFNFTPEKVETTHMKMHGSTHHGQGHNHSQVSPEVEKFYHEVCHQMEKDKASKFLLVGPGMAHTHLKVHMEKHHPALVKNILGVEAMEKLSDGQIIDHAKDFFKKHDLYI